VRERKFLIAALVVLVGLIVLSVWLRSGDWGRGYGDNNANFPDGIHFVCSDKTCEHGFTLTVKQWNAHHADDATYGTPAGCPHCGTDSIRADLCKTCRTYYPIAHDSSAVCPRCNPPAAP